MQISFDPTKDNINREKHGVSLAMAAKLEWECALVEVDVRQDYGEVREIAYVPLNTRLYFVAYTWRDSVLRVISLRKANQREFDYYVSKINQTH